MNINEELIRMYDDFPTVGTITGSVTSLDERGRSIICIRPPMMGGIHKELMMSVEVDKFFRYYTRDDCWGFNLYRLKDEWKEVALNNKEALRILSS